MVAVTTQAQQCGGKQEKHVERREANLFKNNIFVAAVYYNPQYRMIVTELS